MLRDKPHFSKMQLFRLQVFPATERGVSGQAKTITHFNVLTPCVVLD